MMAMNMEWWLTKQIHKQCFELFGVVKDGASTSVMQPILMRTLSKEEAQEGIDYQAPVLSLTKESCQSLMDELWSQGIRPSNGDDNVRQLAATQAHLKDMQSIAFAFMDLKK